jgi:hypothetical protein
MDYTGAMFLASIILAPLVLVLAVPALALATKLRLVPAGPRAIGGYALLACSGFGLLFIASAADLLAIWPARLQEQYLGARYGSPLNLSRFEQSGFQDPGSEWRYRLSEEDAAQLARQCKREGETVCILYSGQDERWYAEVTLQGRELTMLDALH